MRTLLAVMFLLYTSTVFAQDQGIKFVNGLSWSQIKEKAKQENKYIFLDAYTTWCLPCKVMANEVFPLPKIGNFFNANFINVAVQFDSTRNDSKEIQSWYKDVELLKKAYNVSSYPTYLFFNPQGDLVHTLGSANAEEFLAKSKLALDPSTQYNTLKKQFQAGNRNEDFLRGMFYAAQRARDFKFSLLVGNSYIQTQKDLFTKENLLILQASTHKSSDPGFVVLRDYPEKLDAVAGLGASGTKVKYIVYNELIYPLLSTDPGITEYGNVTVYHGKIRDSVDWELIGKKMQASYPKLAKEILLYGKIAYFQGTQNWQEYVNAVEAYLPVLTGDPHNWLNNYSNTVFYASDDVDLLNAALSWSKQTLSAEDLDSRMNFSSVYSNILYKLGRKDEALAILEDVITTSKDEHGTYAELKSKMKKGEKTW